MPTASAYTTAQLTLDAHQRNGVTIQRTYQIWADCLKHPALFAGDRAIAQAGLNILESTTARDVLILGHTPRLSRGTH